MNGTTRLFLAALVAGVFAFGLNPGHAFSQETMQLTGTEKVTHLGTYLYSEQKFATQANSQQQETIFDNTNQTGGFLPPNQVGKTPPVEFLDWGQSNGGTIEGFQIGYATSAAGPINLRMKFYHGTANTGIGIEIVSLDLTGLPGSSSGQVEIFTFDVDISGTPFVLPPGNFGYGYVMNDSLSGPLTADGGTGVTDFYRLPPSLTNLKIAGFFAQFYLRLTGSLLHKIFVNNAGANGDGSFLNPFNNLTTAALAAGLGYYIYVYTGNGPYDGGFAMKDGQQLFGSGIDWICGGQVIVPAGQRPVITNSAGNGVDLANDIYVGGFDVVDPLDDCISATNVVGTNTFGDISLSGGAQGIDIINSNGGTFTFTNMDINSPTGIAFNVVGGSPAINFNSLTVAGASSGVFINESIGDIHFGRVQINNVDSSGVRIRNSSGNITFKRLDVDSARVGVEIDSLFGKFSITGDGTPDSGGIMRRIEEDFICADNFVQVEIVALSLVSVEPIQIGLLQAESSSEFDVQVCLSPISQPAGSMAITLDEKDCGTFDCGNSTTNSLSKNSTSQARVALANSSFTGAVNIRVGGTVTADIEITDNSITTTGADGLTLQTSDSSTAIVTLTNNDVSAAVNDFVLTQDSSSTFQLAGFAGGDAAAVAAFIRDNNVGTPSVAISGSISADPTTSVEESDPTVVPRAFRLAQNYPNPFNPATTIQFDLPRQAEVMLSIYNINGQLVRTLVSGKFTAGSHSVVWDGRDDRARQVTSGLYVARMQAGEFVQLHKMLLIK